MAVLQAAVETNGWVLAVTGDWPLSAVHFGGGSDTPHPDFPLGADDVAPKLVLAVSGVRGAVREGGLAVTRTDLTRTLVGTKPLRRPWPDSTQTDPVIDEVDLGGGLRRVRIALSDRLFAGEVVEARFAAGWRSGEPAAVLVATNASERVPVVPICRWATPPYQLVSGVASFRVDLLVASHYSRHAGDAAHQAVAGVRWFASDGVRVNSGWVTGASDSTRHGDGLRCWGFDADLSGLSDGVISVWAHVYPWVGEMRAIGSAATGAGGHVADAVASFSASADAVLHLCYEGVPGARYARRFAFFDAVGGAADYTGVVLHASVEVARAAAAVTRPRDVSMLMRAMHAANVTLPAGNGLAGGARSCDFWEGIIPAGMTVQTGTTAPGSGFGAKEGYLLIRGDPAAANPVDECQWATNATTPANLNNARYLIRDLTLRLGGAALMAAPAGARMAWTDRVKVRAKAGQEAGTQVIFTNSSSPAGTVQYVATETDWQGYGVGMMGANLRAGLVRHCRTARYSQALVFVTTEQVYDASINYATKIESFGGWASTGSNAVFVADQMLWGCRSLRNNGRFYIPAPSLTATSSSGGTGPTDRHVYQRFAVVNNLCVRANQMTGEKLIQIGENAWQEQRDTLWEGNSFVSHRASFHNDPPDYYADLVQTGVTCRNNYWERISSKADTFSTQSSTRTGTWEIHYGVGWEGNVIGERSGIGDQFQFEFNGLRHYRPVPAPGPGTVSVAGFLLDNSNWGPNAVPPGIDGVGAGGGDYRPGAGSALLTAGRAGAGSVDRDIDGYARGLLAAVGAVEGEPVQVVALTPDSGWLGMSGTEVAVEVLPPEPEPPPEGWRPAGDVPLARTLVVAGEERLLKADGGA